MQDFIVFCRSVSRVELANVTCGVVNFDVRCWFLTRFLAKFLPSGKNLYNILCLTAKDEKSVFVKSFPQQKGMIYLPSD